MRLALAIMLTALTGCAATAIDPARGMYDHGLDSIRRAEGDADDRVSAEAQADILRAFMKLRANLKENSSDAAGRKRDMADALRGREITELAETFHGRRMPRFSPEELGDVIGGLIDAAAAADSRRLVDFRRSIAGRDNPDGFDPARRAVLDRELRRRGIIDRTMR